MPATSRKGLSKPQYKKTTRKSCAGVLTFLARHKRFECACHLHGLRWEVLQKFLKERIWICQGQLHRMLLL